MDVEAGEVTERGLRSVASISPPQRAQVPMLDRTGQATSSASRLPHPTLDRSQVELLRQRRRQPTASDQQSLSKNNSVLDYFNRRRDTSGKDHCVLLSWTSGQNTCLVDISVGDPDDESEIIVELRRQYYTRQGWLRRYMTHQEIQLVNIHIAGSDDADTLIGHAVPIDIPHIQRTLEDSWDHWSQKAPTPFDRMDRYPDICDEDIITGKWYHNDKTCFVGQEPFEECPTQLADHFRRKSVTMQGLWFLQACWQNPSLARQQKYLNLGFDLDLIRPYSAFQLEHGYQTQPRDVAFRGIQVIDRLNVPQVAKSTIILSVVLVLVTAVSRVVSGSWDTAFAAGGLFGTWTSVMLGVAFDVGIR